MADENATMPSSAFDRVPADARVPGFYAEISGVSSFVSSQRVLIVGQRLTTGTVAAGTLQYIAGDGSESKTYFGRGSQLADTIMAFRRGEPTMELWAVALDDDGAGTAAELDVTISGTATASGTISFYVGDDKVKVGVASGDTAAEVAAALQAAIAAATDLTVTATVDAAVVTVTFRHKGALGNDIRLAVNVRGADSGEALPAGIAVSIPDDGFLASGATDPDQTPAFAAMGDERFDFILVPYTAGADLDAWEAEMDARFGPLEMHYGAVFTGFRETASGLLTKAATRNDKYISMLEVTGNPGPLWRKVARMLARVSRSLANHPVRPHHGLELVGELPPALDDRLAWVDRNTLIKNGVSTTRIEKDGTVTVEKIVTTYKTNSAGDPDESWSDIQSLFTAARVSDELRAVINRDFIVPRCILVDDDAVVSGGLPVVSPRLARARLIGHGVVLQRMGLIERIELLEKFLIVSREARRLNIKYAPDLANPLDIAAVKIEFSIQWPDELVNSI